MSTVSQLPDSGWLTIVAIVVAIFAIAGMVIILSAVRSLRSGVAEIVKSEIASAKEASPVSVQQPLVVKPHENLVTREQHEALEEKMDTELGRERSSRKRMHEEIAALQSQTAVLRKEAEIQTRQLTNMDQKMDQVLMRLPRP